jgi:hypothetical protein
MTTTNPSRRALLAGAPAAAAALAVGAGANVAAISMAKAVGLDWPAIVPRAEAVVDKLQNYYGAEWSIADQDAAAAMLKYCRDRGAGLPDDETAWKGTLEFFWDYGQSLDWVVYGDPVSMIATMAARSPRGRPAWEAEFDPIFAAIEAHRTAIVAVNAADDVTCKMRGSGPDWDAASQASSEATDDEMDALREVLNCRPKTIEGVVALLDHLGRPQFLRDSRDPATVLSGAHAWYDDEQDEVKAFPRELAAALRNIIGRRQA